MTGGAVLAGGAGRRLGRPKAGAPLGGVPLAERAVALLRTRCAEVVVASRPEVALPPLGVPVVHDRPGSAGPLAGIAAALAALRSDDALVLACDLPLAAPALDALLRLPPGTAAICADAGRPQPLCARYPRLRALAEAEGLLAAGEGAAHALAAAMAAALVPAPAEALLNVNAAADLARAEALLAGGEGGAQAQHPGR